MWEREYTQEVTGVSIKSVWQAWADVNNWHHWQNDLDYCRLKGSFSVGNHFILKPKGSGKVKIELIVIKENHFFTDCTKFFLAKMYDTHMVEKTDNGVKITNKIVVTGILKRLWIKLVVNHIANSVPSETKALITYVKKTNK